MAAAGASERDRGPSHDEGGAADRRWLRSAFWAAFVIGPIATALGFLDVAAHMQNGPGIGLEGGGAPNALPYLFVAIAFTSITGAIFARFVLTHKPSLIAGVLLGFVSFVAAGLASGPIFRWKWAHDCERGVARACYAVSQLATDPVKKETLGEKACGLGDPRACPSASASASAGPAAPPTSTPPP
jgi:hypothetical protein